jgi:catechol 2,3-dioxygenase-like lactoylglutathione lyase family enzyme
MNKVLHARSNRFRASPGTKPPARPLAVRTTIGRMMMLGQADATPMIAVKDIDRARKFYEETLGLETKDAMGGEVLEVRSGDTVINVYRSEFAGTNQATALTFDVDDIEGEVNALKSKGVVFEQYDMPGLDKQGDLYVAAGMKTTWFKDPDGNILSLFEGEAG